MEHDGSASDQSSNADEAPKSPVGSTTQGPPVHPDAEGGHRAPAPRPGQGAQGLAGIAKRLSDDPRASRSHKRASRGERRLTARMSRSLGGRAVVLHDRTIPRSRARISHIAIAPSGVWIVDAKNNGGRVDRRNVGGWSRRNHRFYVGGRDQTSLGDGLDAQAFAARHALEGIDLPITGVLCFTDGAAWRLFAKPFRHGNVWVTSPRRLVEMVGAPGSLGPAKIEEAAIRLSKALPPAS